MLPDFFWGNYSGETRGEIRYFFILFQTVTRLTPRILAAWDWLPSAIAIDQT